MRDIRTLFAAMLAVAVAAVTAPTTAAAATRYVDDDWTGFASGTSVTIGSVSATIGTNAYATLSAAITAAAAGDTLRVGPGTYSENYAVNKSLTLLGAQAGVKATGSARSGGESLLQGTGGSSSFVVHVQADNVTIDGFAITPRINPTNASLFGRDAINVRNDHVAKPGDASIGAYRTGITIRNNWIYSNIGALTGQQQGITFGESPNNNAPSAPLNAECANVVITDNYIDMRNTASSGGGRAIVLGNQFQGLVSGTTKAYFQYSNFTIDSNRISGANNILFQSQLQTKLNNMTITNNTFENGRSGISIAATMTNSTFSNNLVQDVTAGSGVNLCLVNSVANNNTIRRIGGGSAFVISGGRTTDPVYFAASNNSSLSGNSITYNDVAQVSGTTYITGLNVQPNLDGTGVSVNGTTGVDANTITLAGNTFINSGFTSSIPSRAVVQRSLGKSLNLVNATPNVIEGLSLSSGSSDADLFTLADATADVVDASNLGAISLKSGRLYLTPASYWTVLGTSSADLQRALKAASSGSTVMVKAGAYDGGPDTLNTDGVTVNVASGVSGASILLGSASGVTLAGAGNLDVTGNASGNIIAGNAGANSLAGGAGADDLTGALGNDTIDGGTGVDLARYAGAMAGALSGSSTLTVSTSADGSDAVSNVEQLVFSDGSILIIGVAGSEYATLNAALAANPGLKAGDAPSAAALAPPSLYGVLAIDSSTPFASAADLAAILARFVSGSTITVSTAGMSSAQVAAVGANAASLPVNSVSAQSPTGCLSTVNGFLAVPVKIANLDAASLRSASVTLQLSSNMSLYSATTEGSYFNSLSGSSTFFQAVDNGGGSYTVDLALLGLPCGQNATNGTLFTLYVQSSAATGTGTVSISSVDLRDCNNGSIVAFAGGSASVTIDNTVPTTIANLAAAQVKSGNDGDGTTKIALTFTAPSDAAVVEVYRAGFGNYPEYDDAGGSTPATPSYPPAAPWALTSVTASGQTDEVATRDFYYYVVFTKDACGNISAVSNKTSGTLNYHLGDVASTVDNLVSTADISRLGFNYGVTLSSSDARADLDVGPTTDRSVNARPTTDNKVGFEDLMMFAINFGQVSMPADGPVVQAADRNAIALSVPELPAVGQTFTVGVNLEAAGDMQGLSLNLKWDPAVVEPVGVQAGELLSRQMSEALALSAAPGNVDIAVFGNGLALAGTGEAAKVTFRVTGRGDAGIGVMSAEGRGTDNRAIVLGNSTSTPPKATPTQSGLAFVGPNPSAGKHSLNFALAKTGAIDLAIYSVDGRRVKMLAHGAYAAGNYPIVWDGRDDNGTTVKPGLYWVRLTTRDGNFSRTVIRTN